MAEDKSSPKLPPLPNKSDASLAEGLIQSEGGFRLLFMNNPQPMWVFDAQTNQFLEVNRAALVHYGYSREEFLKMRITDIRPPEDVPRLLEDTAKARAGLRNAGRWRHLLKDGRIIDVEITSDSLCFAGREAVLVVVRDVTEHRQTEEKYRGIVENAVMGIYQTTPEGRFLSANPALAKMLGYDSPQQLIGSITDIAQQLYVDPNRRQEMKLLLQQQGELRDFDCQLYRKDGSQMWVSTNIRVVSKDGVLLCYEGMTEDITKRKTLEAQLLQAQKMEAVGLLAGGVAHDFNNALSVITGYSGLLQMRLPEGDPCCRYVEEISKASNRASTLIRQLLAFSRKQVIQPVTLDLNNVISDMEKMLRRLIGEDVEIVIKQDPNLARVKADPGQIEQILMNLAVNARDAMPHGGKLIVETANAELDESYVRQHAYFKAGRYATLSFSDTGCGIDKATQARIFEPFFTTKEAGKGTGLGLSTVYGIVKQNDGYIRVYSEPGKGATFRIYLPPVQGAAQVPAFPQPPAVLPRGSGTVLLVEDEEALRTLARNSLESHGYTVLEAANGDAAVAMAEAHSGAIDLLLTDVIMPGMSGRELANRLVPMRPNVRVLYMSGYAHDLVARYGVLDPDTMLLEKPFTLRALLTRVQQALQAPSKTKAAGTT